MPAYFKIFSASFLITFILLLLLLVVVVLVVVVVVVVVVMFSFLSRLFTIVCRSQWPRGLRPSSAAARLLRSWVRIPPRAWMFICCERCVFSGRGLCDELITRPEETYLLWCVAVCDLETS